MKITTVSSDRNRDTRRTVDLLHKLAIPYATEPLPVTVRVTRGDQIQEWTGFQPHLIRKHCGLAAVKA